MLIGAAAWRRAPRGRESARSTAAPGRVRAPRCSTASRRRRPSSQNQGVWHAKPILISGASAYRRGEFLYQDYLYDDHGAKAPTPDPTDPRTSGDSFSAPNGTYTYPTDAAYAGNAADLVEFRVKPLRMPLPSESRSTR